MKTRDWSRYALTILLGIMIACIGYLIGLRSGLHEYAILYMVAMVSIFVAALLLGLL